MKNKETNANYDIVDGLFKDKWITPQIKSFIDNQDVNVVQYRNYYFGMQIYGMMFEKVGLDEMFELLFDPERIVKYFEDNIIK